jgi:cytochrome c553
MAKLLRWAGYGLASIFVLFLIAAAVIWLISSKELNAAVSARPEHLAQPTQAQLADAERRARALGCFSCHGEGLRGNKMFDQPMVGTVWAPNLTEVAAHATDQQLAAAIRQGVSDEGTALIVMPSEGFQHLSDSELAAIIGMIRRLPRGGQRTPENSYGPIGRLGIVTGRFKTAPELVAEFARAEPVSVDAQFETGRRLAMLNCSGCHGPQLTGQEAAPGEISPDLMIVGAYDLPAFTKLLRTGVPAGGQKLNMMGPTARSDLSHLTDAEIAELHGYLAARAQALSK